MGKGKKMKNSGENDRKLRFGIAIQRPKFVHQHCQSPGISHQKVKKEEDAEGSICINPQGFNLERIGGALKLGQQSLSVFSEISS